MTVDQLATLEGVTGPAVRYWIKTLGLEVERRFPYPMLISVEAWERFKARREQVSDPRGGARPGSGRKANGGKFGGTA
jgi:hypothetical protein